MSESVGWYHPVDESDQWDGFNDPGIEHFRGNPILHLAREVIQNALDAGESDVVDVKMHLHKVATGSLPDLEEFKKNLQNCYEAAKLESVKAEVFFKEALAKLDRSEISVLEISDYNTSGMKGPSENGTSFYAFMKAKGQSRKVSDTSAGTYGIGKFAPYAVSDIRTIFVSTVYKDEEGAYQQLTQGKAMLMSHDRDGRRKQGIGFWGIREKCQPIKGVSYELPDWIQRTSREVDMPNCKGTKVVVLCFDASENWQGLLAVSVAENFFGAISSGKLRVEINGTYVLDQEGISDFFEQGKLRNLIENEKDEPGKFDNCKAYLAALQNMTEIIVEQSEMRDLGLCQLRILIGEGYPKKVCALRNGMFISDSLSRLKSFSDFKEFVAVIQCESKKGNALLRAMEPPRHDDFEPERLSTKTEQRKGARALKALSIWIRDMLKRHAKEPVSEITEIDELRDFFGEEGEDGSGRGVEEVNPYGEVVIRAKPIKIKVEASSRDGEGAEDGEGEGAESGGGGSGVGGSNGEGGSGSGTGGVGGGAQKPLVVINNVRSVISGSKTRKVAFTPASTGRIALRVLEAGSDADYKVSIIKTDKGDVENGSVILDVTAGSRFSLDVELEQVFSGAVKVVAYEI